VEWVALIPFRRKRNDETLDLNELLILAREGDEDARNQILKDYIPFVAKSASQATGRYINQGNDDEFSIALAAFNEAIDRYDMERGTSFLGFADTVIRRRLIDFFRSKVSRNRDVPLTEFDVEDDEDNIINYVEVQKSLEAHQIKSEEEARAEEIGRYIKMLEQFEISMEELVELSPKHVDARENAMEVARIIASKSELREYLLEKKSLPLKLLSSYVTVSRKTIERQRKYIIAIVLILIGDFEMLQDYIG
jgi:RNA polymerase sigma factor